MTKRILTLAAAIVFLNTAAVWGQFLSEASCPVMPAKRVRERFYVDHGSTRVYLCCGSCIRAFKKNPQKYLARIGKFEKSREAEFLAVVKTPYPLAENARPVRGV